MLTFVDLIAIAGLNIGSGLVLLGVYLILSADL